MEPCPQRGEQALVAAMAAIGQAFRKSEGQLRAPCGQYEWLLAGRHNSKIEPPV